MKMERNLKQVKNKLNKSTHITKKSQSQARKKILNGKNKAVNFKETDKSDGVPNITECSIDELNEIIKRTANMRKQYSRTYAEQSYTPLTQNEKMKFVEDFSINSDKRLHLYSELFKEIKTQISFISNNISTSLIENDKTVNDRSFSRGLITGVRNFNNRSGGNMNNIDEENEILDFSLDGNENLIKKQTSRSHVKTKTPKAKIIKIENPNNINFIKKESKYEGECDCLEGDENVKGICMPSKEYRSNNLKDIDYFSSRRSHSHTTSAKNVNKHTTDDIKHRKALLKPIATTLNPNDHRQANQLRKQIEKEKNRANCFPNSHIIPREPKNSFFYAKMELQANSINPQHLLQNKKPTDTDYNAISSSYSQLNSEDLKMSLQTYGNRAEVNGTLNFPNNTLYNDDVMIQNGIANKHNKMAENDHSNGKCLIY